MDDGVGPPSHLRMESAATTKDIPSDVYFVLKEEVLLKSRVRENFKHGSVRDVESASMIEYCGTPHIERGEKLRKQTISKEGDL